LERFKLWGDKWDRRQEDIDFLYNKTRGGGEGKRGKKERIG